jgi:hypothetical protein
MASMRAQSPPRYSRPDEPVAKRHVLKVGLGRQKLYLPVGVGPHCASMAPVLQWPTTGEGHGHVSRCNHR